MWAQLLVLLCFLSASSVAIVLLVPVPRYDISWLPFLYVWLAWSVDNILGRAARVRAVDGLAVTATALVFCFPVFVGYHSDREILADLRAATAGLPRKPVIAGDWVLPLALFAYKDEAVPVNAYDGLSVDGLKNRTYDVFVSDAQRGDGAPRSRTRVSSAPSSRPPSASATASCGCRRASWSSRFTFALPVA